MRNEAQNYSDRVKIKQITFAIEIFKIIKVSKCEKMLFKDNLNEILSMVLESSIHLNLLVYSLKPFVAVFTLTNEIIF